MIAEYQSNNPSFGYNITAGGEGTLGVKLSDATKKKISESRVGRFRGEKSPNFGKHPSLETRQKMRESKVKKYVGSGNPFWGKHHSEESKQKIRDTKAVNGYSNARMVECLTTGKVYASISEASRDTGADGSSIRRCCIGEYQQTHGLRWKFYEGKIVAKEVLESA